MSKTQRLPELLQLLRCHRYPLTAQRIAEQLHISVRTVYRDILSLQQQGVEIEGSAGVGYLLKSDGHLPPLMFSRQEIDALVLGLNWVTRHTDDELKSAARHALAKVQAVIPPHLTQSIDHQSLLIASQGEALFETHLPQIRQAIHQRSKISLRYKDLQDNLSTRIIWPVVIGYFERVRLLCGWCELRQEFRNFRVDRIEAISVTSELYPGTRHQLLKRCRDYHHLRHPVDSATR
ncbi:helix-turn-helix transcriptional regulator [Pantoea dispersa]|uniref:DNA-binding protein n=1 Tax=Pantoea dispersa TaxID=59814 RepID=A0A8E1V8Z8_9GAMM|nr:YafY family protein [Pantoea dispersa]KTR89783.1 DNA-binding protein [Pantoea dispersa]KTS20900.1 DNA-binding protein [Pantoea dispersa]KTS58818.1 DNA-binding protein [Pantoea dispersa]KTS68547.1 DNA-binding protein [Pantoea dispersa]